MISKQSSLRDVYQTAVGRDIIKRLLLEKALSEAWITKTPLGRIKLKTAARFAGEDLIGALLTLVNGENDSIAAGTGEISKPWYKNAVFYQIYPRSFKDSNGDGIGDLRGIIAKLDYIQALGVDAIWLSPIYDSPNDDMGYDIRDYRKIMTEMGTMQDFDALLDACHSRGLKLIMDLVFNHSSDEHEWYQKALAGDKTYQDYYFFREGTPEQPPNNWRSFFSGPAWKYEPALERWMLHLFSAKQPDLNWDNPALRQELYAIVRWWLEKGVDGFRLDVVNYISKAPGLPQGSQLIGDILGYTGIEHYYYGPHLHDYLHEMQVEAFAPHKAFSVGETPGIGFEMAKLLTNEAREELNLVFIFDHLEMPGKQRWDAYRYDLNNYKNYIIAAEQSLSPKDWQALFFENHDNPRMVSKVNPEPQYREPLAKALGLMQLTLRGTPFVFQGQELGAVNQNFSTMSDLRDVESINKYQALLESGKSQPEAWQTVMAGTRDHARTPIDWTTEGGFSANDKAWLLSQSVGDGHSVAEQENDPDSVLSFYQSLLKLRKTYPALQFGQIVFIEPSRKHLFMYERQMPGEMSLFVEINLSANKIKRSPKATPYQERLLNNYADPGADAKKLRPYEASIYLAKSGQNSL